MTPLRARRVGYAIVGALACVAALVSWGSITPREALQILGVWRSQST
jgi:hypothetical protein